MNTKTNKYQNRGIYSVLWNNKREKKKVLPSKAKKISREKEKLASQEFSKVLLFYF